MTRSRSRTHLKRSRFAWITALVAVLCLAVGCLGGHFLGFDAGMEEQQVREQLEKVFAEEYGSPPEGCFYGDFYIPPSFFDYGSYRDLKRAFTTGKGCDDEYYMWGFPSEIDSVAAHGSRIREMIESGDLSLSLPSVKEKSAPEQEVLPNDDFDLFPPRRSDENIAPAPIVRV